MRVAFFQRLFANYQYGLVHDLAEHSENEYVFYGDSRDPAGSGIAPITPEKWARLAYRRVRTWYLTRFALQPAAVWTALFGKFDAYIFEGSVDHPTTWFAVIAARLRGKRVLLYTHGWNRIDKNPFIRELRLAFYRMADGLLLYGHKAKSLGMSLGFSPEKMYVAFNCLDYEKMISLRNLITEAQSSNLREQLFGSSSNAVVMYLGRLIPSKRVDLLIDACSILAKQGYAVGALIVGGGPELSKLAARAERAGLPAHFTGAIYSEEKISLLLSASNVLVVPGPVGLPAMHAMTYGTPVVSNDAEDLQMPEAEAIVPGLTGAFFRHNDPESLANVLIPFIRDAGNRDKYSANCRSVVDQFYNPRMMRKVFDRAVRGDPPDDLRLTFENASSKATQ